MLGCLVPLGGGQSLGVLAGSKRLTTRRVHYLNNDNDSNLVQHLTPGPEPVHSELKAPPGETSLGKLKEVQVGF